ncbi:acetaldehyde dehydrogenase, partial [candidate division KSB1 bacterium]|nr:acetaldehyde dehydrogenase [candidate division KSB1 bacterium]
PLSAEKLSPTFVLYEVNGVEEGIRRAQEVLNFGGRGHTAAIHAKNDRVIRQFGLEVPAFRVVVNSPASIGAVGYTNRLMPSMTLGCGTFGGNITSDNISAHHLMNIKRVAYETKPLSAPRNGTTWRPAERSDAPYTKALSGNVSRKGSTRTTDSIPKLRDRIGTRKKVYGATGMTESEVEQVIEEFVKNR